MKLNLHRTRRRTGFPRPIALTEREIQADLTYPARPRNPGTGIADRAEGR